MQKVIRPDLTFEEFELFRNLIKEQSGIDLSESQIDSLRISLLARTSEKRFPDYLSYYDFLKFDPKGKGEFKELLNLITINETSFFRQPGHFKVLREYVIPDIIRSKKEKKLNIWSAGCSTGEEPYSIAITIKEYFPNLSKWQIRILATDVSNKALERAKEGVYGMRTLRLVSPKVLDKCFTPLGNAKYQLKEEIKNMVCFGYHNLIKEPYPLLIMSDWDIIFCRNVTIYFNLESTKRVIENFYESLGERGYLFVGYAEMVHHLSEKFELLEIDGNFVYRKSKENLTDGLNQPILPVLKQHFKEFLPRSILKIEESEEEMLNRAIRLFEEEEYALAFAETEKLVTRNPENLAVYLLRAEIYANEKEYNKAEKECLKAIKINKMSGAAHYLLALIYEKQGRWERAIDEYRKTLYIDRNFAMAHFNLANIYRQQGRLEEAIVELKKASGAARKTPQGEWTKFSGGFHAEAIAEAAEEIAARLKEKDVE